MLQVMKDIGGVEIPTSLAKLVGEDTAAAATTNGDGHAAVAKEEPETKPAKSRV
jgi:hypothetical protein